MYAATQALSPGITPYTGTEAVIAGTVCSAEVAYVEGNNGPGYEVLIETAPGLPSSLGTFVSADDACFGDDGLLIVPSSALPVRSSIPRRAVSPAPKPFIQQALVAELDAIPLEELALGTH